MDVSEVGCITGRVLVVLGEREGDEEGEDGVDASSITIISIFR